MRDLILIILAVQIYQAETSKQSKNIDVLDPTTATKDSKPDANFQMKPINKKNLLKLYEALATNTQKLNLPQPETKSPPSVHVKKPKPPRVDRATLHTIRANESAEQEVAAGKPILQLIKHPVQKTRDVAHKQKERYISQADQKRIFPNDFTQRPQIVKSQTHPGGAVRVPITVIHRKKPRATSRYHAKPDTVVPIKMENEYMPPITSLGIEEPKKTNLVSSKIVQSQTEMPTSQQLFLASIKKDQIQRQVDFMKAVKEDLLAEKLMERFRSNDNPSKRANEDKDDDDDDDSELTYDIDGRTNHKIF